MKENTWYEHYVLWCLLATNQDEETYIPKHVEELDRVWVCT
jgi:hypothetical protein